MQNTIMLPNGHSISKLGMGTGGFGSTPSQAEQEIRALQYGIEHGLTTIDTADMYGNGGAEQIVGKAIKPYRDNVFLTTKVFPQNAKGDVGILHCENSLKRLNVDVIDLYLVHWCVEDEIEQILDNFIKLKEQGKIRSFGVSNYQMHELKKAWNYVGKDQIQTNQVIYNLNKRGIEGDMLPAVQNAHSTIMAYAPFDQGRSMSNTSIKEIALKHNATEHQIALAFLMRNPNVFSIFQSSNIQHIQKNIESLAIILDAEDMANLGEAFPSPTCPIPLDRV